MNIMLRSSMVVGDGKNITSRRSKTPNENDERFSSAETTRNLFYAINQNDCQKFALIIANNFDVTAKLPDFNYGTCLHLVSNLGSVTMTYLILSCASSVEFLNAIDNELRTPIMYAIMSGKNDIVKLLIQCGADVTIRGPDSMTALHIAVKIGNFTGMQLILNSLRQSTNMNKFDKFLNSKDNNGVTAVMTASEYGFLDMVIYFLNLDAAINLVDNELNTALHYACKTNKNEIVLLLLQANCNFDIQNIKGDTALHIACRNGNTRLTLLLLAYGATLDVRNANYLKPFECLSDLNSHCAKVLLFNLQMRKLARFDEQSKVFCLDISNGRELHPIKIVRNSRTRKRNIDAMKENINFKYITKSISVQNSVQIDLRISQMRVCSCNDNCTSDQCQCSHISIQHWYNSDGRLNKHFNFKDPAMIFECNDVCNCNKLKCRNRIVQNGAKVPLEIFECPEVEKGWGVKSLGRVLKGTFISEYTGEILTDIEADNRTHDSYFFDLGASQHCIDAHYYGNVSRFFNHSCSPNTVPIRVYYEHQDIRFPKVAFFASCDIEAGDEICFDYGDKFWMMKYKSFTCVCGSNNCRYSNRTISKTVAEYNAKLNGY